ncbi:glycosyl transferase family 2 [alpha proteobacterium AAP81b]|nr:glycosyl transferase family 2 [alpha proteobacterium AAP81b]
MIAIVLGALVLAIWLVLAFARAGFWRFAERDSGALADLAHWPSVVAVIPARNEADVIARSLASVLAQDYPGDFRAILVDDQSDDGTAAVARALASPRLTVLPGGPRPAGWTGKLWALDQGIHAAGTPDFLWLTDADIGHAPDNLRRLAARAVGDHRVMVSLMARLHCANLAERWLIPAFVYFFAMLYPFGRVNDRRARLAAAAGGCVLIDRAVLANAGGIAAIAHEIIDDCSLARRIKPHDAIWLGISDRARSLRPYAFADIAKMVARSAYAQLGYSPLALIGTLVGLLLVYAAPVALALFASGPAQWLGLATWGLMALTMVPILRAYETSPLIGVGLPGIALAYAGFTLDSAIQHWRGRGGMWKGRAQALGTGR